MTEYSTVTVPPLPPPLKLAEVWNVKVIAPESVALGKVKVVLAVPGCGFEPVVEVAVRLPEDGLEEYEELPTVPPRLRVEELEAEVTFATPDHCTPDEPWLTLPLPDVVLCAMLS